jgi:GDSL/SGNH-like Acyl-Esterase family found in Pmr5 and Cas1p
VQFACPLPGTNATFTQFVWRNDARLEHLDDALRENFPTVLILNKGAHYQNDTAFLGGLQRNIRTLQQWQHKCRALGIQCHLFWRTTVPGHPGCATTETPQTDFGAMQARVENRSAYDNVTMDYHWYDFAHQNELALQMLQASNLSYRIIPAYEINMLRPDDHRAHQGDCLHNCYPGKMDVYNQILLHYLALDRTPAAIFRIKNLFNGLVRKRRTQFLERQRLLNGTTAIVAATSVK